MDVFLSFWNWRRERASALSIGQGFHVAFRLAQGRIAIKHGQVFGRLTPLLAVWFPFLGVHDRTVFSSLRADTVIEGRLAGEHEGRQIGPQNNQGDIPSRLFTCRNTQQNDE